MGIKNTLGSFLIVILFFAFIVFTHFWIVADFNNIKYAKLAGQTIKVELAITKEAQDQGLSARTVLAENEGMLFVFSKPEKYYFWMQKMNFPLDIVWIGEDMKVIYIKKDARPESYPETYSSESEAKYVLEIISGFSEKNNLKIGDRVEFKY